MISKKKMFETWNQHLELDESVWDDLPNTQISSFTKKIQPKPRVLVAILGGGPGSKSTNEAVEILKLLVH